MIGREEEFGTLRALWLKAKQAEGQVILLSGEPGIGKSRLMRAIREEVAHEASQVISLQCAAHYSNAALHPLIEHLRRAFRFEPGDAPVTQLEKVEHAVVTRAGCTSSDAALLDAARPG
jgi:predicted ATPase